VDKNIAFAEYLGCATYGRLPDVVDPRLEAEGFLENPASRKVELCMQIRGTLGEQILDCGSMG
jgi:hypothetical protein